jgi:membrane-associated phospholipid phosphatase
MSEATTDRAWSRWRWGAAGILAGYLATVLFDRAVFKAMFDPDYARSNFHDFLWMMGWLPTWVVVGAALVLVNAPSRQSSFRGWLRSGLDVPVAAALAGVIAEAIKRIIGRERPFVPEDLSDPVSLLSLGEHRYKPFLSAFVDDHNLGFPSSHVAVAFAGALCLTLRHRRLAPLVLALATGCAYQRLAQGAHFLSDVYGGIVIGCVSAVWIDRRLRGQEGRA